MSEQRLMNVELKLMDQERTIETLNEVLLQQIDRIDALEKRLARALESQAAAGEEIAPFDPQAEKPPHY